MGFIRQNRSAGTNGATRTGRNLATRALALLLACGLLLTMLPAAAAKADAGPAKILFTLDDGWRDNYEYALPVFQAAGFPATVYVNSDMVDNNKPDFMTLAQLQELYSNGWDLANHTTNHHEIGLYNDEAHLAELRQVYEDCQNWLISHGFHRGAHHAAYPSGRYTRELISVLRGIGVKTARNTVSGLQNTPITTQDRYYELPMKAVSSNYSLDSCKNAIMDAVANGSTVIFMLHRVLPEQGSLTTTVSDLQELLAFTKTYVDQGAAVVQTISQWYDEQIVNPLTPVTPPAPPVTADDGDNTVSGLTVIMEYSLDSGAYTPYHAAEFNEIDLAGDHTLAVRYVESGINPPGPNTVLHFTTNRYAVTFHSNGGSAVQSVEALDGDLLQEPEPPQRTGHTFAGWYRDEALTDGWAFGSDPVTADTDLYAKWDIHHYTVTFKDWDGTELKTADVEHGGTATPPGDPSRAGHTFTGWDVPFGSITGDLVVTALYDINRYTVSFDRNGGETDAIPPAAEVEHGQTVALPAPPAWPGHTFTGWNTLADGSGTAFTSGIAVTGDITVFAQWAINSYTVTFKDWDGATLKAETVQYLGAATAPEDPSRAGHTFTGWDVPFGSITGDLVVTAQYAINSYTVTFDKNGGTTEANPRTRTMDYGAPVALPAPPTRTGGYVFIGWNTLANGKGTAFAAGTALTGDITVYAQWLKTPAIKTPLQHTYNSLKLTWAAAGGATGYEVWSAPSASGAYTRIATVTAISYTNTNLSTNKPYYYKIRAYHLNGSARIYAGYSSVVSGRPVPAAPATIAADSASYRSAKVKWGAVAGASGYEVYRALYYSTGTYTRIATTTATSYTNTGLSTGSAYYYKVRAYRTVSGVKVYGPFSAADVARPTLGIPPTVRAYRASSSSIKVTWGGVSGASGYELWRSTSAAGGYVLVKATGAKSFTNTKLTKGKWYYYKVRAYRKLGKTKVYSPFSAYSAAKP